MRALSLLAFAAALAAPTPTSANFISLLTADHCPGGCGPQDSFGQVSVSDIGGGTYNVDVSLFNGNRFVNTGALVDFGFNLAEGTGNIGQWAATIMYTSLTPGWMALDPTTQNPTNHVNQIAGAYHEDKTGVFSYGLACVICEGGQPFAGPLLFQIMGVTNFIANVDGNFFVADIISGTTGQVGLVSAVPVPIVGAGVHGLILTMGCLLGFARRRRTRSTDHEAGNSCHG